MTRLLRLLMPAVGLLCAAAHAGIAAARTPIVVYSGPSQNSGPVFLLNENYPLVVISETSDWLTVCMHDNSSGYVLRGDTKPSDNIVVLRPTTVRAEPAAQGAQLMLVAPSLMLATTGEVINDWLPVRHATGIAGFIPAGDAWGHAGC